ncbi:PilZ domain-containing protein [Vibrio viridaestus]|uniref:PilZ domain-containing protein n=1 Tax=Vibrio viridaestus TaxID=2487322 RepID=A0A3N9TG60_9VIBR|nr:PilZ domain-containing protein [Vibrio viridaestus]RQW63251.1 PilZ domain-containing protein [Vibrio viridaestus]
MVDQEYFTVHHALKVNIEALQHDFTLPEQAIFEAEIPTPFLVANEFSQLDSLGDLARQELKDSEFKHVLQLLEAQNNKLNLLLNYMLTQEGEDESRYTTLSFGASQFTFISKDPFEVNSPLRVKLFLEHPAAAIYLYGHVAEIASDSHAYQTTVKYDLLRESDQDLLIKAALFQQQKLLRQRSIDRNK